MSGEIDYLGAEGGRLAGAFAAGCVACWSFLQAFFWRGIRKSYQSRIDMLDDARAEDNRKCAEDLARERDRITQLETMLWMHGPQALRSDIQGVLSEAHLELRRAIEDGVVVKLTDGREKQ